MNLQERHSKWELSERSGDYFRTISLLSAQNCEQTFAVERISQGHRTLHLSGTPSFPGQLAKYKRLSSVTNKQDVASGTSGGCIQHQHNGVL
jgi:hypothetical protein